MSVKIMDAELMLLKEKFSALMLWGGLDRELDQAFEVIETYY